MLCPEVWDFKVPQHYLITENGDFQTKDLSSSVVDAHFLNHSVSLVIPDTINVPEGLQRCLLEDTNYYRVDNFSIDELTDREFIEAFVKRGEVSLLSINRRIDVQNSVALLPNGRLILSLTRDRYQRLGLEGSASVFLREPHDRYVVTIDLKSQTSSLPATKNSQRVRECLRNRLGETFDVIVSWDSPDEKLCPSSIAAWFHERKYKVSLCQQQQRHRRTRYGLHIPIFHENGENANEIFEWIGVLGIDGDAEQKNSKENYVNTYECPKPFVEVGQVHYLQYDGFFTRKQIRKMYNVMREYAYSQKNLLWCSLHVQGFLDSPVSWGWKEHNFYLDGDNSFTVIFQPNGKYVLRKGLSSNNKLRIRQ